MVGPLYNRLDTKVLVSNASIVPSSFVTPNQTMRFMELMMNYMVDFNIMSMGVYNGSLLLPLSFNIQVIDLQNGTFLNTVINSAIDASLSITDIMEIVLSLLICVLTASFYCLLKERGPIH